MLKEKLGIRENPFAGAWRLVSLEIRGAGGNILHHPYGPNAIGYIIYSEDGYMSSVVMSPNRPKFNSQDITGGTAEEKIKAIDTYLHYCGPYEVKDDKVIHHVQVSLFPNWIGVDMVRLYKFSGNTLTLSTPSFEIGGIEHSVCLIWERV